MSRRSELSWTVVAIGLLAWAFLIGSFATPAAAAPLYWTSSGTWDSSAMWSNTSGSGYALAWTNSSDAVFEGTAGTVAINGNPQANTVTFNTDGYLITGGSLTLSGAGGNVTTGSGTDTIASVVQGTVGFNKNGAGTLLFAGANTYSGGTTINAGTLQVGNNNASGWFGSGSIVNNATLAFSRSDYVSVSQAISGTGTLNVNNGVFDMYANSGGAVGSGQTINVAPGASFMFWAPSAASNSSNWVLNSMGQGQTRAAINQDGGGGGVTLTGSITLAGNSRLGLGGASTNSMYVTGPISGSGMLYAFEASSGHWEELYLSNSANSYSGGTSIEAGYVRITTPTSLGTGPVYVNSGASGLCIDEVSGTIANNIFLGGTPTSAPAYGYGSGTLLLHNDAQTATFSGSVTVTGAVKIRDYSAGGTSTFAQAIGGSGTLTFDAGGTAVTHNQYWVFGGSSPSTYGNTMVWADGGNGIIRLSGGGGLPTAGTLTMTDQSGRDTVFDLAGCNQSLGGLTGTVSGYGDFVMNSSSTLSTLTINNASANTFAGVIGLNTASATGQTAGTGAIALVVSGSSTFALGGSNTYTGGTTISSGTLQLGTGAAGYDGTVNATSGIANNAAMVFNPYASQTVTPAISGSGNVTKLGPGTTYLNGSNSYSGGTTISAGVLDIASSASLPGWITPGGFVVTAGGALAVPDAVTDANIATLLTTGNFAAGAAIGFDTSSGSRTYNPVLADTAAGALGLVKAGSSSLTLTAVNTYSGGTTIANAGSAAPGSALILANTAGQAIQGNVVIGNGLAGFATLQMSASNQLTPNAVITFNDTNANWSYMKLMGNSQTIGNIQSAPGGYGVIENTETDTGFGNAVLTLNNSAASSFDGYLRNTGTGGSGTLALNLAGTGTLTLIGGNISYSGGTTIGAGGNLFLQNTSAFASPVRNNGTLTVSATGGVTSVLNGAVSGSGPLVKTGSYALSLGAANSYTGGTTLSDGEITLHNLGGFGSGTVTVGATGCVDLWFTGTNTVANNFILNGFGSAAMGQDAIFGDGGGGGGNYTLSGSITLNANSSIAAYSSNPVTVTGPISGVGGLVRGVYRTDTGIVTLSSSANSYSGGTTVGYGTLRQGVANAIPYGAGKGGLQVNSGAAFDLYGYAASLNGLSGTGTVSDGSSAATLTVGNSNASSAFAGVIQNAIGLIKTGSGSLTLTGASTYTGGTSITGGTLQMGDGTTGHDGAVSWNVGTTTDNAALVYNVFGTQAGGNIGGSGSVQKLGAGTLLLAGNNTYAGPTIISAGTLQTYGPVAHYTLDNTTADATGHSSALTAVGSPGYTTGKFGQAITLNGSSQYLTQSYTSSLAMNAYTVSVWANLSSTANGASPAIISTRNGGDDTFDLQYNDSKLHADIGSGGGWLNNSADYASGALSGWNMITYAVTSNGYTIYLNGSQVASGTYSGTPLFMKSGQTLSFGSQESGGSTYAGFLNGSLDDIAIYNSALSPSQIGTLYSGQLPAHLPAGTPVQLGSGAVLDLNGISETVASLADVTAGSGGTITSSLSGALTLTLAPAANTTTSYSGVLQNGSGTLSLVMSGSGTQILAGSNTYSGGTTIKGGVLDITGTGSLPGWNTAATRVSAGGALVLGDAVTDGNVSSLLGAATFNAGALIGFDTSNGDRSYGAAIVNTSAGSLGLLKLGGNTLFLTGTNTYTGGTTVGAGVLSLASAAALPGWSTANAYKINSGGGLAVGDAFADADVAAILATGNFAAGAALGFDTSNGDRTYAVNITDTTAGSLALVKLGGNTLFLAGTNTYTGGTTVGNGALSMATTAALPGWNAANAYRINSGAALAVGDAVSDANVATILAASNFAAGAALGFDTSAGDRTYGAAIVNTGAGSLGLLKIGAGNLILTAANTYTGGTTISAGTLQVGNNNASGWLGTGPIVNNATFAFSRTDQVAVSQAISGTGTLNVNSGIYDMYANAGGAVGSGQTINVASGAAFEFWAPGAVTNSSNWVLNSMGQGLGREAIDQDGGGGLVTLTGSITLAGNSLIGVGGTSTNNMTISGPISGTGTLFVNELNNANNGWLALILSNSANSYSGGTSVERSWIQVQSPTALGTGPVYVNSGVDGLVVNEFSGTIPNNFYLATAAATDPLGYGLGTLVLHEDGYAATFSGSVTLTGNATIRLYDSGGTATFAQAIGGTGNLTFQAGGSSVLHNQYWILGGSAPGTYGNTTIQSDGNANAIVQLAGGGGLPIAGILTLSDAAGRDVALDLAGCNQTLAGLTGTPSGLGDFVMNSSSTLSTLTITNTAAMTFGGVIGLNTTTGSTGQAAGTGNIALVKNGGATLTLSGSNSYTGATNVNGGMLDIAYPLSNIAAVNVAGGATLALGNLVPDATITTLLSEGAYNGGSVLGFDTAAGNRTFNPTITDAATGPLGLLTLGANALTLTAANTYTGGTTINSGGTLVLANTAGQAIQGNLVIGNQSAGNTVLQMASANQFSPNALVTFNDTTNNWAYMRLLGYSQTIGNIQSASGGYGVIENTETQTGVGAAVLTLNNSASSSFDGYLRNTASGSGSLALNLAGTGTLTLIGGNITYSGGTTIGAGGNLFLQNTTAFASPILNNGTLTVSSTISTTAFANLNGAVSGVGPLVKTGSYGVILNASNSYTGGTTIGDGELRIGNLSGFGSGTVTVGATGCVDLWFTGTNTVANDFILNGFGSAAMGQDAIFGDGGGGGGSYTLSGSITLNANSSIAAYSSNPVTVSGPISGVGGLVRGVYRTDAGIVTLSNSGNSYAGGTTVGYGTLRQGVANAIPSGAGAGGLCVNSGAVFDLYGYNAAINALSGLGIVGNSGASTVTLNLGNGDATGTFSGTLQNGSGVVNLTKSGSGTQILNGTSSYTGVTTVNNGVLQFGTGGTLPLPATSGIAVTSVVAFNHGNSLTLSVPVTGSGALVKNGSGTLTLLGANTYQGGTTIVNGMLTSEPAGSVGSGPVTVASGGTWNLGSNTQTVAGLSGNGLITRAGVIGSPVTFSSNAASGVSTAKTYAALLDFGESTGATVNGVAFTGAALSGTTGNVTWSLAGATSTFNNNPDAPTMSDAASGGMYQLFRNFCYGGNPGVLTLTGLTPGQAYEVDLYDANYGGTRVQNMTFTQGNGYSSQVVYNEAPTTADYLPYNFIAQSSSLTIMASPQTTAATYHWYGLSVAQATAATPALTIGGANNYEFDGAITGMTSLVKQGAGTQLLTGNNTYLGGTTIAGGSLVVTGTVANSAVTVAGGATLGGAGLLGGAVTVAGGASAANQGTINLVDNTIGTLTLSSPGTALTLGSGAGVDLEIEAGNASDCVALTAGSLALGGAVPINITPIGALSAGTYTLFTFSGGTTGSGSFVLDAIPGLGNTLKDSLSLTAGSLQLIIAPGIPANAYWQAGSGAWSTVGNWSADQGNTTQIGALPASITNLYFATAGGTATIDQAFTVNSLSLTTSNSVTVAGTGTLTLVNSAGLSDNGAAAHTINAPLALGTAQTWTINGPSALTVAGVISDAPGTNGTGLALSGGGTVVLSGANTYSGGTTIAAATTLQLGDGQSAHGSVTGNIADNGALLFDNAATTPYAGSITGSGGLTVTGSSTLTLSGTNSYGGGTTITGGGLALGGASALPSSGGLVLAGGSLDIANYAVAVSSLSLTGGTLTGSGGALTLGGAGPIDAESGTASATLAGSGGLNKTTAGTVVLGGNNSYTGGTSIEGGVLQLGGDHALPNGGNLTVDAGTLDLGGHNPTVATIGGSGLVTNSSGQGTITVNPATAATVNATIADGTGMVGVVKAGNGSLVLNAANSYSGGTTVSGGTLQLGTAGALGSIDGALTVNAGTLDLNGQNTTVGKLQSAVTTGVIASGGGPATLTAGAGDASSTFAGVIVDGVGPVSLVKTGSGTLGLAGANSYRGGTTINGGAVSITSGGNLGDGNVTIGAATLQTSGNVVLDAARTVTLTDLASAIDTPQLSDTTTLDGPVIGTGALNKEGAGILTLAAASGDAYTGDTNVLAGILDVAADNALSPTSNLVIGDGASVVLDFGGGSGIGGNSFLGALPSPAAPSLAAPSLAAPALSPAGISTVPEPGTLVLLVVAVMAIGLRWYRRESKA